MKHKGKLTQDSWKTPSDFYELIHKRFNFDFDPCPLNHDVNEWNGLELEWGNRNFCNPPYSRKAKELFVKKAIKESKKGKLCVLLIPVSTGTKLFHDFIRPEKPEIEFIRGRLKFEGYNNKGEFCDGAAMHDSMLVIFDGRKNNLKKQK
tara:strand:- start:53 stop:499 length:447 start_codon:yes stop_codon:yes gene_type:complete